MQSRVFDVTVREERERTIVACWGEIDIASCEELSGALDRAFSRGLPLHVDLGEISFVDSTGIRCLVRLSRRCAESGIPFGSQLSAQVRRVTDVLGVTGLLLGDVA